MIERSLESCVHSMMPGTSPTRSPPTLHICVYELSSAHLPSPRDLCNDEFVQQSSTISTSRHMLVHNFRSQPLNCTSAASATALGHRSTTASLSPLPHNIQWMSSSTSTCSSPTTMTFSHIHILIHTQSLYTPLLSPAMPRCPQDTATLTNLRSYRSWRSSMEHTSAATFLVASSTSWAPAAPSSSPVSSCILPIISGYHTIAPLRCPSSPVPSLGMLM
mmetsp:Transcript_11295/g.38584  ORF Transcript_11295/g.38584 Transcript_11295/m.38584 type:complete len:219 (+) Transcript_11295:1834-2490(+)